MTLFQKLQWGLAIWTMIEGTSIIVAPTLMCKLSRVFSKELSKTLSTMPKRQLQTLGTIETGFGLCLAAILLWFQANN